MHGLDKKDMKQIWKNSILLIVVIIITGIHLQAQPGNYWSVSFNSEASLLSGAVVGGNSDITSIYYNPAGIAEIEEKKFALNANLFNLPYSDFKNSLGTGLHTGYLGFTVQPRFISFMFKLKNAEKLIWQFAIFNRNSSRVSLYDQIEKPVRLIHPNIQETYVGNFDFVNDYLDSWGGIGLAYRLTDNLTVGGSLLFSLKNFSYMKLINVAVHPLESNTGDTILNYTAQSNNYEKTVMYDVRTSAKIGFRYHINQFGFGLNISTPSLAFMGNSDVKRTISSSGIYDNGEQVEDVYYNASAVYLKSGFKDPFSISFGAVYKSLYKKSSYYFTTEYFHKIDTYKAVDGTAVDNDEYEPSTDFLSYKFGAKPIVNFAVGWQYRTSDKLEILMGFRTDFDPYSVSNEGEFENMNEYKNVTANLYHFSGGAKFNYKQLSVIAGIEYSTGKKDGLEEFVNFAEPAVSSANTLALTGEKNNNMTYTYNSIGFHFGFTLGF